MPRRGCSPAPCQPCPHPCLPGLLLPSLTPPCRPGPRGVTSVCRWAKSAPGKLPQEVPPLRGLGSLYPCPGNSHGLRTGHAWAAPLSLTHCPTPKPRPCRLTPLPLPVFPGQLPPPLPPATCRAQRRLPEALPRAWSEGGAPGQFGGWGRGCSCRAAPAHRGRWSRPADWEARLQEAVGRRAGERGLSRRGRQEGLREDPAPNRQLAALLGAKGLGLLGSRDSGPCHQAVQVSKRLAHLGARGVGAPQESALEELCAPTAQAPRGILKQHHPGITRPEAKGPSWVTSQVQGPRRRPAYGSCDFGTPGSDRPA